MGIMKGGGGGGGGGICLRKGGKRSCGCRGGGKKTTRGGSGSGSGLLRGLTWRLLFRRGVETVGHDDCKIRLANMVALSPRSGKAMIMSMLIRK